MTQSTSKKKMSDLLLRPLYRKLNQVIFESNFKDCMFHDLCKLCEREESWFKHKVNLEHRRELRRLVERLMKELLPLGIVLRTEAENDDKLTNGLIYCVLCGEKVGKKFDSDFRNHVASAGHQSNVNYQYNRQQKFHELDQYLEAATAAATLIKGVSEAGMKIDKDVREEEAALIKGVSRAGMKIDNDGSLTCAICDDFQIMDQQQFVIHVTDSKHLTQVNEQLIKIVMMLGFNRGILLIQSDGAFHCTICKIKLSDNFDTSQVYAHIDHPDSSSGAADHHKNVTAYFADYDTYDAKSMNLSPVDCDRESLSSSSDESFRTGTYFDFCYASDGSVSDNDDYLGGYDGFGV